MAASRNRWQALCQKLAEEGYITITADASFPRCQRPGTPHMLDNPAFRTEDIHGMVDVIASYPARDSRIGALGICGGGGYTLKATQTDKRVKAVATLSMFNFGIVRRNGF